jgi:hypothetical protein
MFFMMNAARFVVGQDGTAIGERAYQQAVICACERVQGKSVDRGGVGTNHLASGRATNAAVDAQPNGSNARAWRVETPCDVKSRGV